MRALQEQPAGPVRNVYPCPAGQVTTRNVYPCAAGQMTARNVYPWPAGHPGHLRWAGPRPRKAPGNLVAHKSIRKSRFAVRRKSTIIFSRPRGEASFQIGARTMRERKRTRPNTSHPSRHPAYAAFRLNKTKPHTAPPRPLNTLLAVGTRRLLY